MCRAGRSETIHRYGAKSSLSKRLQYIRMHDAGLEKTMHTKHAELMNLNAVAKRAGVSTATVSRVLNDLNVVKNSTRARVLKAAEELKYHPTCTHVPWPEGRAVRWGFLSRTWRIPFSSTSSRLWNQRRTRAVTKWLSRTRTTAPSNWYPARG